MIAAVLLALALGVPPDAAPAGELVRAVRVEAAARERLLPLVGVVPGRPLDREAVRRAVELMYATGRFDDVVVEIVRPEGEEGVEVVFRPHPAPLLVGV
ncbi:MAG TPA: POTRA domain-containing protein, partial [Vicinamibacteria bacterium]|nr:POTRA domain-containing protein [Vicinamibacteria bacterium]